MPKGRFIRSPDEAQGVKVAVLGETAGGRKLTEINPILREYVGREDLDAENIMAEVLEKGRLEGVRGVPKETARLFVTALGTGAKPRKCSIWALAKRRSTTTMPQSAILKSARCRTRIPLGADGCAVGADGLQRFENLFAREGRGFLAFGRARVPHDVGE